MRSVARRIVALCLTAIPTAILTAVSAAALAEESRGDCPSGRVEPGAPSQPAGLSEVEQARKAFQGAARKIYAELLTGLTEEQRMEMSKVLGCDAENCADKAAEFLIISCAAFTPTAKEAGTILSGKFDDAANDAVVRSCAKYFATLQVPLPMLFTHLIEKAQSGKLKCGIELELTARFLAFHASKAMKLLAENKAER